MARLYTRQGDRGYTWCSRSQAKVPKTHPCIEFVGVLDEAEAALGFARSLVAETADVRQLYDVLLYSEELLFRIGFAFSTGKGCVSNNDINKVEELIDTYSVYVEPVFIMNPDSPTAAAISVARTIVRRAERRLWACLESTEKRGDLDYLLARLLNRLSDLLYALQVAAAKKTGVTLRRTSCNIGSK